MSEIRQSSPLVALQQVVEEVEQGIARLGWDRPPSLFALVTTADLLQTPELPEDIAKQLRESWDGSATQFSAIMQDSLKATDLAEGLAQVSWPDTVAGAIVSAEMVTLPPEVEAEIPDDFDAAAEFAANHPSRAEVRFTVGVLRSGESWCALRAKDYDDDTSVAKGEVLTPGLVEALRGGFV